MKRYPSHYIKFPEPTDAEWRDGVRMKREFVKELRDNSWHAQLVKLARHEDLKEWAVKAS